MSHPLSFPDVSVHILLGLNLNSDDVDALRSVSREWREFVDNFVGSSEEIKVGEKLPYQKETKSDIHIFQRFANRRWFSASPFKFEFANSGQ